MKKKAKMVLALLMAVTIMNATATPVMAQVRVFTSSANGVRLRETAGLNGRLVAYLGKGDQMACIRSTGLIDDQVWRYGRMFTRDVAGLWGYASATYMI